MDTKYDVFISYSRKDLELVKEIKAEIDRLVSIDCWMDLDGIESGEQFEDVIINAICKCDIILFMMSANSMQSEWALDELDFAKHEKKRIVLVSIDNTEMSGKFYFRYHKYDTITWNSQPQREKLIRNLKSWIGIEQKGREASLHNDEKLCQMGDNYFHKDNFTEAVGLYREAAEKGNAKAQYNLGYCYYFGYGVLQDVVEAEKWYQKAAEQGYENAKKRLEEIKEKTTFKAKEEESTDGVEIYIDVDVDCDLYCFKKRIKTLSPNEYNIVYLKPGKHKIEFVSHEYSDIKKSMLLDIPYEKYSDFISVTLLPQIQKKKEEIANYPVCSTKKIAIIGSVGSGVTSLLCGIIGNMCRYHGAIYDMPYNITSYSYNDDSYNDGKLNRPIKEFIKHGSFSREINDFTFPDKSNWNSNDTTIFRIRCIIPRNEKKDAFHLYFSNLAGEDCVCGHLEAFDGADYVILCLPPDNDDIGNTKDIREVYTHLVNYMDMRCCLGKLKFTLVLTKKDLWDQKKLLSPNNDYTHDAMDIWEKNDLKNIGRYLDMKWGDYPCFAVNLIDKDNEGLKLLCNMIVQDVQNELP